MQSEEGGEGLILCILPTHIVWGEGCKDLWKCHLTLFSISPCWNWNAYNRFHFVFWEQVTYFFGSPGSEMKRNYAQDGWYPEPYLHPILLDNLDEEIWDFWANGSQMRFAELMPSWDKISGDLGTKWIFRWGWTWIFEDQRAKTVIGRIKDLKMPIS